MVRTACLLLVLVPAPALAHLVSTGVGPFYDGVAHLFVSPAHLGAVIALALLAGLAGAAHARLAVLLTPAAWLVAGLLALEFDYPGYPGVTEAVPLLALGGLAAFAYPLRRAMTVGVCAVAGVLYGTLSGAAMAGDVGPGGSGLLGTVAAVFCVLLLVSAAVVGARAFWLQTAARVLGSWIAAVGLLMIGWAWSGATP